MGIIDEALAAFASNIARAGLSMDQGTREHLRALEGRLIRIVSEQPTLSFYLLVEDGRLTCLSTSDKTPHVMVSGSGLALARWLSAPHRTEGIRIEGDEGVLLEVSSALSNFSPDLLSPLTRVLGPDTTQTLLGGAELAVSAFRSAAEGVGLALEQTAANRFITRADTNALLDSLDELRLRIDRLASRIKEEEQRR